MLMLVSPAKTLDFESQAPTEIVSKAAFLNDSQKLVDIMQGYDVQDLQKLMSISEKIAILNVERFALWQKATSVTKGKQAMYAFQGDVYTGLEANTFNAKEQQQAQDHLRILSGLYGLLKPMDIIMPYRLEMGSQVPNDKGANLYAFWQETVTAALNKDIQENKAKWVLNLASNEYFKAVKAKSLSVPVYSPEFKDFKNGKYKIISFYAKKARGLMARYCIHNKVKTPEAMKKFDLAGYYYSEELSTEFKPVFLREEQK